MTDSVISEQQSVQVLYSFSWPVPIVETARVSVQIFYEFAADPGASGTILQMHIQLL